MHEDCSHDWLAWAALACRLRGLALPPQELQAIAQTLARLSAVANELECTEPGHG